MATDLFARGELVADCVRAYNDFLSDWCSADPDRLVAVTAIPFWDADLAVAELQRCAARGHRAVNLCNQPQDYGQPPLAHRHWESGVGWIPAALETFDWQWRNGGVGADHPEYDLLASEYFRRQIYGCFWFEERSALDAIARYPDNILFESDYPHPTCQHPGPRSPGRRPRDYAEALLGGVPDEVSAKVLHDNAALLYRLS